MARSWVPCYILNNILNPVRGLRDLQIDNACGSCYAHKTVSLFWIFHSTLDTLWGKSLMFVACC